jgi:peroxin-19
MLDDFSNTKLDAQKPAEASTAASTTAKTDIPKAGEPSSKADEAFSEDDFAKQLQAGMAELLGDLEKSVWRDVTFASTMTDDVVARHAAAV